MYYLFIGNGNKRICLFFNKAVHNEPAAVVADKAHWTGLNTKSSSRASRSTIMKRSKKKKGMGYWTAL
jgi:hypothetical protein